MASNSTSFSMEEGQSISKPPYFNGANYPYWKNRMMLFIRSTDYMIWDVVFDGPFTPNFKMEPNEDIKKMLHRFSIIVNGLKGYGEIIPKDKLVRKLIYSLPESWDSKKTAIIEGRKEEEKKKEEKKEVEKKKIGIALKASLESNSSEKEDEEMAFLARRNRGTLERSVPNSKKKIFGEKKKLKAHVATWSDVESSDEDEEEVANLCRRLLMMSLRDSLYEANYDLELKIKSMQANQKDLEKKNQDLHGLLSKVQEDHQKKVGDLKASLNKVGKRNFENASASRSNHVRRNLNKYNQRGFQKTSRSKRVRSFWVPKDLITSNNIHAIASWIPKAKASSVNSWYLIVDALDT
ncbi:hypothetical protein V6N11_080594 [Hibiscus sabdariffa]|uniref:DUF4219 domain-containing protein n=1 Tax=Hibiscus sabdariffa TaxID=183260 RepID=A0ABR2R8J3_9ROSI